MDFLYFCNTPLSFVLTPSLNYTSAIFSFKINTPPCLILSVITTELNWVTAKVSFTQPPVINSLNTPFYVVQKL